MNNATKNITNSHLKLLLKRRQKTLENVKNKRKKYHLEKRQQERQKSAKKMTKR